MGKLLNMLPDADVEPHLAAHLMHITKEEQRPRSIRERRLTVLRVARWLGHPLADATPDELGAWQEARLYDEKGNPRKPTGRATELAHVASYLRWLYDTGRREDDATKWLVRPRRLSRGEPNPIEEADLKTALRAAAGDVDMHLWLRLGAESGLRCVEIAKVNVDEIGLSSLRVVGKGGKERRTVLHPSLRVELLEHDHDRNGYLFGRLDGLDGPPSAARVSERINQHLHDCGVRATAHGLRHRFGSQMYRTTRDIVKVATLMGHASLDTTRGYVRLVEAEEASQHADALLVDETA